MQHWSAKTAAALTCLWLAGCELFMGKPQDPMPSFSLPARNASANGPVVVVLPGRGDSLDGLKKTGIAETIHDAMPNARVILVGATMPYYLDGGLVGRLHEQIIQPLRAAGAHEIWLAGASMGGMGTIMYERAHPGELTGLLLMAPYMGERDVIKQVADGGGPAAWDPGPVPAEINRDNVGHEEWRLIRSWSLQPASARRVWLICGADDRFAPAARMISPLLPADHYLERPGGHAWKVWSPAAREVFTKIAARR